jgi:putative ABC transport system permease protein
MRWYQRFFRKEVTEKHLDAELRFHLEQRTADLVASGMAPEEARRQARLEFGGLDQVKEDCRVVGGSHIIETLVQDLRYGLRQLRRNPGFTAVAVLTLALGIGANTAIFSVVNAVLLRPLPFRDPSRLVLLWSRFPRWGFSGPGALTDPDFVEWRKQNRVFGQVAAFRGQTSNLTGEGEPERLLGTTVTASFFPLLGVSPELGRVFTLSEEKPGQEDRVVLSHELWARRFRSDPDILGKPITLDGHSFTVVGVMPAYFQFPNQAEFWTPLVLTASRANAEDQIVARLKPDVTLARADDDIQLINHRLNPHAGPQDIQLSLVFLHDEMVSNIRPVLLILFAAVGLVLMIACANVANLLLARAAVRKREITIRKALGGSRLRIARQMLTESILLAGLGGATGLFLAAVGRGFLLRLLPQSLGAAGVTFHIVAVNVDGWVLGFGVLVTIATGILFGLAPALQASKLQVQASLQESPSTRTTGLRLAGVRSLLTVGQMALTLVLLVSAGLLIKSLFRLLAVAPGFEPSSLLTANLELPSPKYSTPVQMRAFHDAMLERIASLRGVTAAGTIGYGLPFGEAGIAGDFTIEGQSAPPQGVIASKLVVSPGYFQAMGIPLVKGRFLSMNDSDRSPRVIIVSENFARRFWPDGNAVGNRINPGFTGSTWCTVVGVVGNVKQTGLADKSPLTLYLPYSQAPKAFLMSFMTLVVRTPFAPAQLAPTVRREVQSVDPDLPVYGVSTMEQLISASNADPRSRSILLGCFASLALILATVGIYGVVGFSVAQRTHEIGIRMALGAQKGDVLAMVIGQGLKLTMIGAAIGVAGALAVTRFLSSLLYGVEPNDPATFIAVSLLLVAVALLASYVPARRAAKVDPMVALRYE